jgi:hypothetical protein
MTAMSIRLPDSLHRNARAFADREGVSVNQLVATALAEKLAALGAEEFLKERAARGSRAKFDQALALVPDVRPVEGDNLAQTASRRRGKATKKSR